ncbi:hypothetical protein ACHAXS_012481 [Conticribra weissflogii]
MTSRRRTPSTSRRRRPHVTGHPFRRALVVVASLASAANSASSSLSAMQRQNLEKRRRRDVRHLDVVESSEERHRNDHLHLRRAESDDIGATSRRLDVSAGGIHAKGHFDDEAEAEAEVEVEPAQSQQSLEPQPQPQQPQPQPQPQQPQPQPQSQPLEPQPQELPPLPPEPPATDLRPYRFARIAGGGSQAVPPLVTGADGDVPLTSLRYPYMVSLQMEGISPSTSLPFDFHMCGGVLIAPDMVMSAAHCAYYTPPGIGNTSDGANGKQQIYEAFNGMEIGRTDPSPSSVPPYDNLDSTTYHLPYENLIPRRLFLHDDYDEETYRHDIMLVQIHGRSRYPPVRLWSPLDDDHPDDPPVVPTPLENERLTLLGWGASSPPSTSQRRYSDLLREGDMKTLTNSACRDTQVEVPDGSGGMLATTLTDHVTDDMMCAYAAGRQVCTGDDGGPAVLRDRSTAENADDPERDVVVGIISWGYGCVDPKYPAVMARVESHYGWIREVVCKESSDPPAEFGCSGRDGDDPGMVWNSAAAKETVTLKLKLDKHSVQTGFVIRADDAAKEVVAQRQTGYYVGNVNQIVEERMRLPTDRCYTITFLDSFGDGFCCDWGGGKGTVYRGVDTGYYTGEVLVEVDGRFGYEAEGSFCLNGGGGMVEQSSQTEEKDQEEENPPQPSTTDIGGSGNGGSGTSSQGQDQDQGQSSQGSVSGSGPQDSGSSISSGNNNASGSNASSGSNNPSSNSGSGSNNSGSNSNSNSNSSGSSNPSDSIKSGWSGPVTSPEFTYCTQFCQSNSIALTCGSHACYHGNEPAATSDADQGNNDIDSLPTSTTSTVVASSTPAEPVEWVDDDEDGDDPKSGYHITVQFQFDQHPEEVSWVLYDLTINQVTNFVDFDTYPAEDFADKEFNVVVDVDGPDAGEKKYAFTVYDKSSNGLCCDHGEGYYNVYLGDIEDDLLLLTDDEYGFSSSFYFTLFENSTNATTVEKLGEDEGGEPTDPPTDPPTEPPTDPPTDPPTEPPTDPPTDAPTEPPTDPPTSSPTLSPTTPKPTFPWETKRTESSSTIGAKWKTEKEIPTGRFNDLGGNQDMYKFHVMGVESSVSRGSRSWGGPILGKMLAGSLLGLIALGLVI